MAQIIYATPTELAVWMTGDPEAVPPQPNVYATRLRQASGLVRKAIESSVYDSLEGLPTDTAKRDAVRDATCAQAEAWIVNDIDPAKGTLQIKRGVKSKSLTGGVGGASVTYDDDAGAAFRRQLAEATELIEAAWTILDNEGLVSNRVTVIGGAARDTYLVGQPYNITTGALEP